MYSTDRAGVTMEELTAVSMAGLTLYDMAKAVDPACIYSIMDAPQGERQTRNLGTVMCG